MLNRETTVTSMAKWLVFLFKQIPEEDIKKPNKQTSSYV